MTLHRWFHSGSYSLLGHVDCPEGPCGRIGLVIVPPFGWEDICSYRPLRFLGAAIAEKGIPVLRFDLPGTGDSSGGALDEGLFEAWIRSVDDAAAELRDVTGVDGVALMGVRLGAILASIAASRGSSAQDLVLWGALATGRALLRELRAFASMESAEYPNGEISRLQSSQGLEVGGFLIAPETRDAIEAFDLSALPKMHGQRVLLLSRDAGPADTKSIRGLESLGCAVEIKSGSSYSGMMALPHDAVPPLETVDSIVEFLERRIGAKVVIPRWATPEPSRTIVETAGGPVSETICSMEGPAGSLFGILSESIGERSTDLCVAFLNSGAVRHTGPNNMWVEAARRWALRGVTSVRLDLSGIGESDGEHTLGTEELYRDAMVDQVEIAMDTLRSRLDVSAFALLGLCSGAFWAFQAAIRRSDVRAAILLNPRLFFWDPEVDRRRLLRRAVHGLVQWSDWRRLALGEVKLDRIKEVARNALQHVHQTNAQSPLHIPSRLMAEAWAAIDRHQARLTLAFSEGEVLLSEMEDEDQMPPEKCTRVRCIRLPNCGHTFRPVWAQQLAHQLIDRELTEALLECRQDRACVSSVS